MKNYIKPAISFQFFNLATDVSAGCTIEGTQAERVCGVQVPAMPGVIAFSDMTNCNAIPEGNGDEWGICYYVPTANNNVLGS